MAIKVKRHSSVASIRNLIILVVAFYLIQIWLNSPPKRHEVSDHIYYQPASRLSLADHINDWRHQHGIFTSRNIYKVRNKELLSKLIEAEKIKKRFYTILAQQPDYTARAKSVLQKDMDDKTWKAGIVVDTEKSALQQALDFISFARVAAQKSTAYDQSNTINAKGMSDLLNANDDIDLVEDVGLSHRSLSSKGDTKQIILHSSIKQLETIENLEK